MKEKILGLINKVVNIVKPKLVVLDSKIAVIVPNPKMKKILYIGVGSLFGFMLLIIILGLLLSPFRNVEPSTGTELNKPNIASSSPEPQKELNEMQKKLLELENEIKNLRFPESTLNIPVLESDIKI